MKVRELLSKSDARTLIEGYVNEMEKCGYDKTKLYCPVLEKMIKDFLFEIEKIPDKENNDILIVMEEENVWTDESYMVISVKPEEVKEHYLDIPVEDIVKKGGEYINIYGLLFVSWNEIANMEICDLSFEKYGEDKVALAILLEMTRFGFDLESVDKEYNRIIEKLNKSTENVKNENVYDFNEVFEKLSEKYNLEYDKSKDDKDPDDTEIYDSIIREYSKRQEFFKYILNH